jgi:hypothetical protein
MATRPDDARQPGTRRSVRDRGGRGGALSCPVLSGAVPPAATGGRATLAGPGKRGQAVGKASPPILGCSPALPRVLSPTPHPLPGRGQLTALVTWPRGQPAASEVRSDAVTDVTGLSGARSS